MSTVVIDDAEHGLLAIAKFLVQIHHLLYDSHNSNNLLIRLMNQMNIEL